MYYLSKTRNLLDQILKILKISKKIFVFKNEKPNKSNI